MTRISCRGPGLIPVMALARARAAWRTWPREHVRIAGRTGVNAHLKIPGLVAGMAAGADSIDDMVERGERCIERVEGEEGRRCKWDDGLMDM